MGWVEATLLEKIMYGKKGAGKNEKKNKSGEIYPGGMLVR